jgi:hypothetical protein
MSKAITVDQSWITVAVQVPKRECVRENSQGRCCFPTHVHNCPVVNPIKQPPFIPILVYHGKHGDEYWLADTPERLEIAQRKLFTRFNEWGCYDFERDTFNVMLVAARSGDMQYIRQILESRRNYEYEQWEIVHAEVPE